MLAKGQHTVLVFKLIQFFGDWTRFNGANAIIYTANLPSKVVVVTEDHAGNNVTYSFTLEESIDVWVCYGGDAQVHIPAICQDRQPGDEIKCG
jgi:hypothetical protein